MSICGVCCRLVFGMENAVVVDQFFDKSNWCIVLEKTSWWIKYYGYKFWEITDRQEYELIGNDIQCGERELSSNVFGIGFKDFGFIVTSRKFDSDCVGLKEFLNNTALHTQLLFVLDVNFSLEERKSENQSWLYHFYEYIKT